MSSMIQIPSSALMVMQPEQYTYEEHFIIRFPPSLAASVRSDLQESGLPGDLEINFVTPGPGEAVRLAKVKFDGRVYTGVLCDLPTILETHKTTDRSQYTKIADVHQVLLVLEGSPEQVRQRVEQLASAQYKLDDGLTPPMKNVAKRRFSRKAAENARRMEEIEIRVREMIQADEAAIASNYTLYDSRNRPIQLDRKGRRTKTSKTEETAEIMEDAGTDGEQQNEQPEGEENDDESGDSDFAAELEEDLERDLEEFDEEASHSQNDRGESPIDEAMAEVTLQDDVSRVTTSSPTLPPELLNLQKQISDKRAQLGTVTNPAIRERLEDAIRYLEQQLASRLASL